MTNLRELVAQNIKKYRRIRGLTQEMLAEQAGTSTTHIGMVETSKKFPSIKMLEKIARALDVDTPALFATEKIVILPMHSKSVERLYQDMSNDFQLFQETFARRIKDLQEIQNIPPTS